MVVSCIIRCAESNIFSFVHHTFEGCFVEPDMGRSCFSFAIHAVSVIVCLKGRAAVAVSSRCIPDRVVLMYTVLGEKVGEVLTTHGP